LTPWCTQNLASSVSTTAATTLLGTWEKVTGTRFWSAWKVAMRLPWSS